VEISQTQIKSTSKVFERRRTVIAPVGDVQLGSNACDEDGFKRYIEEAMKRDAWFIGMGDYVDVASPSNRVKLKSTEFYDSVEDMIEEGAERHLERFKRIVKGTEGRWLGMLSGHHYFEFRDGTTSDTRLCQALRTKHLGSSAFVRLHWGYKGEDRVIGKVSRTFWLHHGAGGGGKTSAPLNKLENIVPYFEADVYLIGHMHKKVSAPIDHLYLTTSKSPSIAHRTRYLVGTGSYLKGYMMGHQTPSGVATGTYVEQRMLSPVALGGVFITMTPRRESKSSRGWQIETRVEL